MGKWRKNDGLLTILGSSGLMLDCCFLLLLDALG